jgi:acyl transferase domain-containing protein
VADRAITLLLPGQGAQCERMAAGLYGTEPVFTDAMDAAFAALGGAGDRLRTQWLRPAPNPAMSDAATAQPLLLAVGRALGEAVRARTRIDLLLGHSVGELAAAALAGVFPAAGLVRAVHSRSAALAGLSPGGMLAVAAAPAELDAALGGAPGVAVAAVNGPRQTVLAGPRTALAAAAGRLRTAGFALRPLRSTHAFHSPAMEPVARAFARELAVLGPRPPRTAVVSGRTAAPVTAAQARDAAFWADQLALPVLHWPALAALLDRRPGLLLLDAGPDRSLAAPARRHPAARRGTTRVLPLLAPPPHGGTPADLAAFEHAMERV